MVFRYPLNRFVIAAALVGVCGSSISIGLLMRAQYRVLKKPYCTQALELLESNQVAMDLIGKPIQIHRPDLINKNQQFGPLVTDITVPFEGQHKSGSLHIEADRPTAEDEWSVKKLEVRFANIPDKLLIVYRRKQEEPREVTQLHQDSNDTAATVNAELRKHEWL